MSEYLDPADPYRFGRPPEPVSAARPTGKRIITASWALLREDRDLIWLPVISTITALIAGAILFVPGFFVGRAIGHSDHVGGYAGGVLAAFALSVVSIYFQAALVIGAYIRADGGDPTLGGVLRQVWSLKRQVIGWAVLTTTVGTAIRALEQRLGILGKIVGFLGGIAWAIASFLAVPVLVAEGLGPIAAVKRSAELIRQTWGTGVRTTLRLGFVYFLVYIPIFVLMAIGIGLLGPGSSAPIGIALIALAVLAIIVVSSVYSAITTYARAMIYRYAVGQPVPGIQTDLFAGAFKSKGRRGRRR